MIFDDVDIQKAYNKGYRHGKNDTRLNWIAGLSGGFVVALVLLAIL